MKNLLYIFCTTIIELISVSAGISQEYENNQIFVKISNKNANYILNYHKDKSEKGLLSNYPELGEIIDKFELIQIRNAFVHIQDTALNRVWIVYFNGSKFNSNDLITAFSKVKYVEYAEKVPIYRSFYTPNDLKLSQYNLSITKAKAAWDITKGSSLIKIAIVDDAIDYNHEDLKPVLWSNPSEIASNGIDDDKNGYIDDVRGWDAANSDNDPLPDSYSIQRHGTHCAGIACASTDNSKGIASVSFNVSMIPIKIDNLTYSWLEKPYEGVEYAIAIKANVMSMSWGGGGYSSTYQLLFKTAYNRGVVCVAAAGNSNTSTIHYPSGFDYVIAVGSTNNVDARSSFSNFGSWVDVMAPGSSIYSTLPSNTYGTLSGTSMATPFVSGLCALMLSQNSSLSPASIEKCLKSGCDNIDALNPSYAGLLGSGRVNCENSLKCIKPINALFSSDKIGICPNDSIQFYDKSTNSPTFWIWTFAGGSPSSSNSKNPKIKYATTGVYDVKLIAGNSKGIDTLIMKKYISVRKPSAKPYGSNTFQMGANGFFSVKLTGISPWRIVYTDGIKKDTIGNITDSLLDVVVKVTTNKKYWLLSVSDNNCTGVTSDTAYIKVISTCKSPSKYNLRIGTNSIDQSFSSFISGDSVIVFGMTDTLGSNDVFYAIVSATGKILSQKIINRSGGNEEVFGAAKLKNNGYVIVGRLTSSVIGGTHDAFAIKLRSDFSIEWSKVYGGTLADYFYDAKEMDDGNIILTGSTFSLSSGNEDDYVVKIKSDGSIIWDKIVGNVLYNRALGSDVSKSGSVYLASQDQVAGGVYSPVIVKLKNNGTLDFIKYFATSYHSDLRKVRVFNNSVYSLMMVRTSASDMQTILVKSDTTFSTIYWSREISTSTNDVPIDFEIDSSEIIYVSGATDNSTVYGSYDAWVIAFSKNGTKLSGNVYGGLYDDILYSIEIDPKSNAIIYSGITKSNSFSSNNDVFLLKTDCLKSTCVQKSDVNKISPVTISFSTYSTTFSSKSGNTVSNLSTSFSNAYLRSKLICLDTSIKIYKPKPCKLYSSFSDSLSCVGSISLFKNTTIDSNGLKLRNFKWKVDGKDSFFSKDLKFIFNSGGYHTISLTAYSGDTSLCLSTYNKTVFVASKMNVDTGLALTICKYDSAILKVGKAQCAISPFKYKWWPNTGISQLNIANPKASPDSTKIYYVEITDSFGLKDTSSVRVVVDQNCCRSFASFMISKPVNCVYDSLYILNTSRIKKKAFIRWTFSTGAQINSFIGWNPPPLKFNSPGNKYIHLFVGDSCGIDTFSQFVYIFDKPEINAGRDTVLCMPDTLILGFEGSSDNFYSWSPALKLSDANISNPICNLSNAIMYELSVVDRFSGCQSKDSINIGIKNDVNFTLGSDTSICEGQILTIKPSKWYATRKWNNTKSDSILIVSKSGTYSLRQQQGHCINFDTIVVAVSTLPVFDLGKDTSFCVGKTVLLKPNLIYPTRIWSTSETDSILSVTTAGIYSLSQKLGNCTYSDTVFVTGIQPPIFSLGNDTNYCKGQLLMLAPSKVYNYRFWSTGQSDSAILVGVQGVYSLKQQNGACFFIDTINITEVSLPSFSLGRDTFICLNNIQDMVLKPNIPVFGLDLNWSDKTKNATLVINKKGIYGLEIKDRGCSYKDEIEVFEMDIPKANLRNDTTICLGDSFQLSSYWPNSSYTWNTNSNKDTISVSLPGIYKVAVKNVCGSAFDSMLLKILNCNCTVWVPNAFTPNGDSKNDLFMISDCQVFNFSIVIFDRWGQIVFKTNDPTLGWNGEYKGKSLFDGVFVYYIKYTIKDKQGKWLNEEKKGTFHLLRNK